MTTRPYAVIAGLGPGLGVALAATLAEAGYNVAGLSRSSQAVDEASEAVAGNGGSFRPLTCDLTRYDQVEAQLAGIPGDIEVLIHAGHRLVMKPFAEIDLDTFVDVWRATCLSAVHTTRAVLPGMTARRRGTIVYYGATASRRGGARFSAFASAKFALRGFAQAVSREYAPQGIHIAHLVIDGLIDQKQTDQRFGPATARRMTPDSVAAETLRIVQQGASAWTHELDLRPAAEAY